ncbi:amino acid ABC transporter substrate-binding protein, PAAT family [Raineyella antarctica]|uniref:Amino acid ABC transporter substrate-binding protein, PAAT family n=1 Tax=Raineyella antarctica TaxID=1577474 RepID=A0A1G6H2A6_9ACTN|nr:ABC transporter substrate-binding protein [Raineyella antarctica]SDB88283.1 amino acid ABC transporter substrate-binding protein, PAAT family [Raineyella antarctica]
MKTTNRVLATLAALVLAGGLSACGGSDQKAGSSAAPTTVNTAAPLYAQLPQAIKDKGSVQVGTDAAYAPMEYFDTDGKTIIGFDKDLGDLLATKLGVPLVFNNATFDGLITQINSKRFDAAMTAMSDTPERQKEVDFVDYYMSGSVMIVKAGNPHKLASVQDLCGQTIALQRGTVQDEYVAKELSPSCEKAGKGKIEALLFDHESEAMLQIQQDRAVAGLQDYPVAVYSAKQSGGKYETVGDQVTAAPLGIAVSKDDTQLRDALKGALQASIDDGSYAKLLNTYGTPQSAVKEATINGGK